jgi:two-component system, OmpR family, phosphate regulon sensor histidine kinase PhoR
MTLRLHARFLVWTFLVISLTSAVLVSGSLEWAIVAALGLTLLFGYVKFASLSQRLRRITQASKNFALGDLHHLIPIQGDDEIASLASALNAMAQNLDKQMGELSAGKQRLELVMGAMTQGVMVLDRSGRISFVNRSIRNLLGNGRDLSGRTPLEVVRRPELQDAVSRVLKGDPAQVLEFTIFSGRILQASVTPVPNIGGGIASVVIVFHDLTDVRRMERMRRDFVANVSHEFKTPLTSIAGYAETLLSGAKDDPEIASDFLRIIERNAKYLETLVTDLLFLARLEAEVPAAMEQIRLRPAIDELVKSREQGTRERNIRVTVNCPPIEIRADRARLITALSNLIDNAIHYNKNGGEVRITAEAEHGMLNLAVSDTGTGIPSGELLRIFERFYRVDKARSRESGGTGLGLAIVKHAIESQGGTVEVASRLGAGATFTIHLPV